MGGHRSGVAPRRQAGGGRPDQPRADHDRGPSPQLLDGNAHGLRPPSDESLGAGKDRRADRPPGPEPQLDGSAHPSGARRATPRAEHAAALALGRTRGPGAVGVVRGARRSLRLRQRRRHQR